jgi:hypothetical protein
LLIKPLPIPVSEVGSPDASAILRFRRRVQRVHQRRRRADAAQMLVVEQRVVEFDAAAPLQIQNEGEETESFPLCDRQHRESCHSFLE